MKTRAHIMRTAFVPLLFAAMLAPAVSPAEPQSRTLKRSEDFILFTGSRAPSLIGSEAADLHLYAYGPSGFTPVPFQVDKRDSEGHLVFPDETMRDPGRDGSALDDNDELVFMVRDAGDRSPENRWVDGAVRGLEIELRDPLDGGRAWAYLFDRPGAGPAETEDYVNQWEDEARIYVLSDQYEVGQPRDKHYYDFLRLLRPDGSWGPDLFDRQKMGMKARLLNGAIPLYVPEQEIKPRTLGVIDGPVRVVRYEARFVEIRLIGFQYVSEFYLYFYDNGYISPVEFTMPVTLHKLFLDVSFYYGMDFTEEVIGSTFKDPANPKGILLDGKPDPDIDDTSDNAYMVLTGPQGSFIEVMYLDELLSEMLDRATYIEEDLTEVDPEEDHPGKIIAGFHAASAKSLRKGTYQYSIYHYYPHPFSDKKVTEILNLIEHPVQVDIRPLARPLEASQ